MNTSERRFDILKILQTQRFEITENLCHEFKVCRSTLRRDIDFLSSRFPIYTTQGTGGGITYIHEKTSNKFSDEERKLMQNIIPILSEKEQQIAYGIIRKFT